MWNRHMDEPRRLEGKKIAILVAEGFEQVELEEPKKALEKAGAEAFIISPEKGKVLAFKHDKHGSKFHVDVPLEEAVSEDYDALLLPGGVMNPDTLRRNDRALQFVRGFFDAHKPVAAICHGPWTLIDAGVIRGRRVTSYRSLQSDLRNAGANWVDEPVVVDNNLITSRGPQDLDPFISRMIEEIAVGLHAQAA